MSELRKALTSKPSNSKAPRRVVETEGYYASDIVSAQEAPGPDGLTRLICRVLIPVSPDYFGSASPLWNFAGTVGLDLTIPIGMDGIVIPGTSTKIRLNESVDRGAFEFLDTGTTNPLWGSKFGTDTEVAYLVPNGLDAGVWCHLDPSYNTWHKFPLVGPRVFTNHTEVQFNAAIATPGTVRL
jgi:hypothetical protein